MVFNMFYKNDDDKLSQIRYNVIKRDLRIPPGVLKILEKYDIDIDFYTLSKNKTINKIFIKSMSELEKALEDFGNNLSDLEVIKEINSLLTTYKKTSENPSFDDFLESNGHNLSHLVIHSDKIKKKQLKKIKRNFKKK